MHLTLHATGIESKVDLFEVDVDENGNWRYESRAVEEVRGQLTEGDRAQLKSLFDKVNWDLEVLNHPVSADDGKLFRLTIRFKNGDHQDTRTYTFSESLTHASWELRDLVHFLRHNVATGGDPVGLIPREDSTRREAHP